jgi:hypothetical protein|tara:strand:- start:658 stop:804 length:147 start_codon:yes stop_codon:yes gene_type:complete
MKIVFDDDREDIVIKSEAKLNIGNKTKDNKNEAKVNKQLKKAKKSNKK